MKNARSCHSMCYLHVNRKEIISCDLSIINVPSHQYELEFWWGKGICSGKNPWCTLLVRMIDFLCWRRRLIRVRWWNLAGPRTKNPVKCTIEQIWSISNKPSHIFLLVTMTFLRPLSHLVSMATEWSGKIVFLGHQLPENINDNRILFR